MPLLTPCLSLSPARCLLRITHISSSLLILCTPPRKQVYKEVWNRYIFQFLLPGQALATMYGMVNILFSSMGNAE